MLNLHDRRKVPSYHSHEKVKGRETVPHVTRIYFTKNSTDYPNITPVSCIQMTDTAIWITYATVQGISIYYIFRWIRDDMLPYFNRGATSGECD